MKVEGNLLSPWYKNKVLIPSHIGYSNFDCYSMRSLVINSHDRCEGGFIMILVLCCRRGIDFHRVTSWGWIHWRGRSRFHGWLAFRMSRCCRIRILFCFLGIWSEGCRSAYAFLCIRGLRVESRSGLLGLTSSNSSAFLPKISW